MATKLVTKQIDKKPIRALIVVALLSLPVLPATSAITSVVATPSAERVALGRTTSVAIRWNVTTNVAGTATVMSSAGQFRSPGGDLLATVNQSLSQSIAGPATVAFAETVNVPADVIERARRSGADHVLYRRSFTDGTAASGEVVLQLAGATASVFGVSRLALSFDNNDAVRVVAPDAKFRAHATVMTTGIGVLRAQWQVAGPEPAKEDAPWRTLAQVTQAVAGAEKVELQSPVLPSDLTGAYRLRLLIEEPVTATEAPVIRYQVIEKVN